jgi:Fe-S cluster assembly protein SufD
MIVKTEAAPFIEAFRARPRGNEPAWLAAHREAALARFSELGFPSRREEAWRFTDLRPLERMTRGEGVGHVAGAVLHVSKVAAPTHRLVLNSGRLVQDMSEIGPLPPGAWLASTEHTLAERPDLLADAIEPSDDAGNQPFASLNAAFFQTGFVLALDPGVVLDRPVEIVDLHIDAAERLHIRNLVKLGAGSRATLIENFVGADAYWTNVVAALRLGEGAELRHARVQNDAAEAIHFAMTRAQLAKGARWESFSLTLGARLSRHDIIARLAGEGAQLALNGAYLLRGEQEATTAIVVDHAAPGGTTRELWKGVVDERAHGVFLGTIQVHPHAQKTDAHQLNKNLLLSRQAHVDTKPELEILADDVKCSHGATVGDLDENGLFYLRARGIAEGEARRMLIEAFAADALDIVEDAALRGYLAEHVQRWLGKEAP